jgi:hypothetical protein
MRLRNSIVTAEHSLGLVLEVFDAVDVVDAFAHVGV